MTRRIKVDMEKRAVSISCRVSEEQKKQLDQIAKSERRPVSHLVYLLVEEGLQRRLEAEAAKRHDTSRG
jgi:predicted transcriptional regulator